MRISTARSRRLTSFFLFFAGSYCLFSAVPVCRSDQVLATSLGSEGAMGSQYTGVVFKNRSRTACRLDAHRFSFGQYDAGGRSLPLALRQNVGVNKYGAGTSEVVLAPAQEAALTIMTANRTGYDESRRCATQIRITMFKRTVLNVATISCGQTVFVTGFHSVGQQ